MNQVVTKAVAAAQDGKANQASAQLSQDASAKPKGEEKK
jgi:hypothetical protein